MWSTMLLIAGITLIVLYHVAYYVLYAVAAISVLPTLPSAKKKLLAFLDKNCVKKDKEYDEIIEYAHSLNDGIELKELKISNQERKTAPRLVGDLYDEVIDILRSNSNVPKTSSVPLGMLLLAHYAKQGRLPPMEAGELVKEVFVGGGNLRSWELPRACRDARSFNRWLDETLRANGFKHHLYYAPREEFVPVLLFSRCLSWIKTDHDLEGAIKNERPYLGYTYYWAEARVPWCTLMLPKKEVQKVEEGVFE